jgi:hypothetical protein
VVPWFRAFEVLGPGVPPVPLTGLPLDSVLPPAPPAPLEEAAPLPPELVPDGACAKVVLPASKSRIVAANSPHGALPVQRNINSHRHQTFLAHLLRDKSWGSSNWSLSRRNPCGLAGVALGQRVTELIRC